jgi:cytidylate kinase/CBS domain-containing protein
VLSREVIVDAAKTYGVSEDRLADGLEHTPGLWARFTGHEENYLLAIQATLADHVSEGNVIYHGLAGRFLLSGLPGVLRVRLIAPLSYRVSATAAHLGITRDQALMHIQKIDHEREKWVRSLYGEDWADPNHYDIVINLGDMSMDTATSLVQCMASSKEFAWTKEAQRQVKDFALRNRVRAHLRFRSPWPELPVNVKVKDGIVLLSGNNAFEALRHDVEQFVRGIEGVTLHSPTEKSSPATEHAHGELYARDIMIPLNRYPHVRDSDSVRDAIGAIASSAVRLEDGFTISPRYVLVLDANQSLVGVLSRRDLIRGLAPGFLNVLHTLENVSSVVPPVADSFDHAFAWNSLLSSGALENAKERVSAVMLPPKAVLHTHDTLGTVVSAMLHHKVDLIPVQDQGLIVGVVLMTDVFDSVAQFIMEGGRS